MNLCKPVCIAENKKANVVIVSRAYQRGAEILAEYLGKITDAVFRIQETSTVDPSIVLKYGEHGKDGFSYRIFDKDIVIEAENEQSMVYAVYDWLERVAGCRYYSRACEFVPFDANLTVCFEEYRFSPVLEYREILYRDYGDPAFAEKHKITPGSRRDENWGFWCHSFYTLCPPEEYFEEHPEYFSLHEGRRVGEKAQLCLSNPEVFEIVLGQFTRNYTQTVKRAADNKRRYAPGKGHSACLLWGYPKGAAPHLAHDFAKQSVVCYTLCRRCRENAVAAGEGKGI